MKYSYERTLTLEEIWELKDLMYRICQSTYAQGYAEANFNKTKDRREAKLAWIATEEKIKLQEEFIKFLFDK